LPAKTETEAEVDAGQISLFGKFSQSSHGTTTTTTTIARNSVTRMTTTRTMEGEDTVATEEGNGRRGSSGGRNT